MHVRSLDRALGAGVAAVAVFHTVSMLALPARVRHPAAAVVALWAALLVGHAALYWFGAGVRARVGLAAYLAAQTAIVFVVGITGALFPVGVALWAALTAQAVMLAGGALGTVAITLGAITLFALDAMLAQDLYRGATWGLLLALAGVVGHAAAALRSAPRVPPETPSGTAPPSTPATPSTMAVPRRELPRELRGLTARELEVLHALSRGARNGEIARDLGIAERTVKAHLASVYTKLGVESRAAAIAVALRAGVGNEWREP
ncbi:regulatory protein LuxR (plasmid) [Gemmatirosa kalamazoonensis]|uniref:Regulatory protein LuxR n=1 Tax=Gemmatirosa kalamazoonensis TaxID=861299 RepID=W0RS63_9BACT|nr:helix-turn-helix transcriptional regulator [Gemmatirosa kalamazoonensis]AHG93814.1 regulatory protein LuxR [Gemmatirosa kalamazoonensis]